MAGEEWLGLYDQAFKPLSEASLKTVATIVVPLYAKLGIKTGKKRLEILSEPPGHVIVNVLGAFAQAGFPLNAIHQTECGCVIEAKLPSDLWSFEGQVVLIVERNGVGTKVEAATNIPGQWFDWGMSTRCLERLFTTLRTKAA